MNNKTDLPDDTVELFLNGNKPAMRVYYGTINGQKYALVEEAGEVVKAHKMEDTSSFIATTVKSTEEER